ncbi:DUF1454 family protein [Enterobacteriaceae bacterium LUAb1]
MKTAPATGYVIVLLLFWVGLANATMPDNLQPVPLAPYLMAGAPSFDMTISQFRKKYNADHADLPLSEYRATSRKDNLIRAASKIDENLYSSTALEPGSGKIRTLQITWLPVHGPDAPFVRQKALAYMTALLQTFAPLLTQHQTQQQILCILEKGRGQRYYSKTEGALRYVVADNGDQGLTFALEPVKLAMGPE